jgi:hypothetical protein
MKVLLIECTVLKFNSIKMVDSIDVEDPSNNGVEAFEISPSINTLVGLGLFAEVLLTLISSKFSLLGAKICSSSACCNLSYVEKASLTS